MSYTFYGHCSLPSYKELDNMMYVYVSSCTASRWFEVFLTRTWNQTRLIGYTIWWPDSWSTSLWEMPWIAVGVGSSVWKATWGAKQRAGYGCLIGLLENPACSCTLIEGTRHHALRYLQLDPCQNWPCEVPYTKSKKKWALKYGTAYPDDTALVTCPEISMHSSTIYGVSDCRWFRS